ncbi:hypothetical protein SAMCFNEI73_pC0013 (plasmid) [Sinorhizobium americanum]|uniref:Uncharacterized protein n=1 Tax=Sinorhizobium americanum TaxID=194963 RepID=A0A1L3LUH6_9HYPH|nr:hypothetical protein SAMCFNEI73_pC0013 [Sinorhizobium americanum]
MTLMVSTKSIIFVFAILVLPVPVRGQGREQAAAVGRPEKAHCADI